MDKWETIKDNFFQLIHKGGHFLVAIILGALIVFVYYSFKSGLAGFVIRYFWYFYFVKPIKDILFGWHLKWWLLGLKARTRSKEEDREIDRKIEWWRQNYKDATVMVVDHPREEYKIIDFAKECENCHTTITTWLDQHFRHLIEMEGNDGNHYKADRWVIACRWCGYQNEMFFMLNPEARYYNALFGNGFWSLCSRFVIFLKKLRVILEGAKYYYTPTGAWVVEYPDGSGLDTQRGSIKNGEYEFVRYYDEEDEEARA